MHNLAPTSSEAALLVLNAQINCNLLSHLAQNASKVFCADGGVNALFKYYETTGKCIVPEEVIGDLDSVEEDSVDYFQKKGTKIVKDEDQDTTDFEKGLNRIIKEYPQFKQILVQGRFSGRLDHTLGIANFLYRYQSQNPDLSISVFGEQSVLRVFNPGNYTFKYDTNVECDTGFGILPVGTTARVTTHGLKWDLTQDKPLEFGKFISISNQIVGHTVTLKNQDPVFVVCGLKKELSLL